MVETAISIHITVLAALILFQVSFFFVRNISNFITFSRKFRLLLLIQNVILGMTAFTGLVVMAVNQFENIGFKEILMILLLLVIVFFQIKMYKKIRTITSKDHEQQKRFKSYAGKVYIAEIIAIIVVTILSFLF
ncbi:hypothetical protein [Nitrosophilus alvini]|uniref:hypothetical protein n=1 Tax=Nitrosophilus alvini TaxID=2714855 RepID=UPI00190971E5|nr:hypothetical protein [Nitrosophilus alvini]